MRAGWEEFYNQKQKMSREQQLADCEENLGYLYQKKTKHIHGPQKMLKNWDQSKENS